MLGKQFDGQTLSAEVMTIRHGRRGVVASCCATGMLNTSMPTCFSTQRHM